MPATKSETANADWKKLLAGMIQDIRFASGYGNSWRQYQDRVEQTIDRYARAMEEFQDDTPADPAPEAEAAPSVDIVRHEVEQLRKANAELLELLTLERAKVTKWCEIGRDLTAERDQLRERVAFLDKSVAWTDVGKIVAERDRLKGELDEARADRDKKTLALGDALADLAEAKRYAITIYDCWTNAKSVPPGVCEAIKFYKTEQPPAAPVEEWRELSKGEQYSGPGQVRDQQHHDWINAVIAACDNYGGPSFVARADGHRSYDIWRFARVRV